MLNVVARPDDRDSYGGTGFPADWTAFLDAPLKGLRIAYSPTLGYVDVRADVRAAVDAAVKVLEDLGASVTVADPGFVITSYSIHYTKLYEAPGPCRRAYPVGWCRGSSPRPHATAR